MKMRNYIIATSIGLAALTGCNESGRTRITQKNYAPAANYDAQLELHGKYVLLRVGKLRDENKGFYPVIIAEDTNGDKRIDNVEIHADPGDPLEELASVRTLSSIEKALLKISSK